MWEGVPAWENGLQDSDRGHESSSLTDSGQTRRPPIKQAEHRPSGCEPGKNCLETHSSNLALTRKEIYKWRCQNNCKGKCQMEIWIILLISQASKAADGTTKARRTGAEIA